MMNGITTIGTQAPLVNFVIATISEHDERGDGADPVDHRR